MVVQCTVKLIPCECWEGAFGCMLARLLVPIGGVHASQYHLACLIKPAHFCSVHKKLILSEKTLRKKNGNVSKLEQVHGCTGNHIHWSCPNLKPKSCTGMIRIFLIFHEVHYLIILIPFNQSIIGVLTTTMHGQRTLDKRKRCWNLADS